MANQPSSSTIGLYADGTSRLEMEFDTYSKLLVACNKRVEMMHAPTFNNEQCHYFISKLKMVTESSSVFLKTLHSTILDSCAPLEVEKHLLSFKVLVLLATEIERFIGECGQDAWLPTAMTWTNMLEFVLSLGFHLELCQVAMSQKNGESGSLSLNQVVDMSKNVSNIINMKASNDKEALLKKISLALPKLHGDEKDLASYLLQRLLKVSLKSSPPIPESKWDFSQYLAFWRSISTNVKEGVSLGRGSSAEVFTAMWLGMELAVKVFYGINNLEFNKEVDILARLCHSNVMSMFCYTQKKQKCSIFMELMDGDLKRLINKRLEVNHDSPPFNIWEAIDLMHQIAKGGKYLHEQGIVHRDLKSMNILVKSMKSLGMDLECIQAKVADFDVSKMKETTTLGVQTMNVGSTRWMAPELIQLQSIDDEMNVETSNQLIPKHPHKCDIYSFAMVCFEILTGEVPFGDVNILRKVKEMVLQGARPELPAQCPSQLRSLIEKCWNPKPRSRPTFDEICEELKYVKYVLMTETSSSSKTHKEVTRMKRKYADALEEINKAIELKPNDLVTLGIHEEVRGMLDQYVDALEDLNKADELVPNDVETLKIRGNVKELMGKYAEALEDFDKVNELDPNDAMTLQKRGSIKAMMNRSTDALEDLNKANVLEPKNVMTLKLCAEIKIAMGQYEGALGDLNKVDELEPNIAHTLKRRAEVKRLMDKYAHALEDLNNANELEPNDAETLQRRGAIKALMNIYEDALEDLNKSNKLVPNDFVTLQLLGEVKKAMGQYEGALKDFNKALELKPHDAFTLRIRAEVKQFMEKYADALEDLNKANEIEPNDAITLQRRGAIKAMINMYRDALEDLNKAYELEPNNVSTLKIRGEVKRLMWKSAIA